MAQHGAIRACQGAPLLELRYLLDNFRKGLKFWFLDGCNKSELLLDACSEILMHGLVHLDGLQKSQEKDIALQKFMDELEWIRKSTLIKDLDFVECAEETKPMTQKSLITIKQFLQSWVLQNLQDKTMCASIETIIIIEKNLLEMNYDESAFMRTEAYVHAFIIGLSAFELNQYSLLSKIDKSLYTYTKLNTQLEDDTVDGVKLTKHKRTSSHPNFSLPPPTTSVPSKVATKTTSDIKKLKCANVIENSKYKSVFPVFRKTKSLPIISITSTDRSYLTQNVRPRSKTLNTIRRALSIPDKQISSIKTDDTLRKNRSSVYNLRAPENQPSSSVNSCDSQFSNSTISSSNTTNSACSSVSPISMSPSNPTQTNIARRIELIKCDNIKIWTDQSLTPPKPEYTKKESNLNLCTPQSPMNIKKPKNISPMNSFLSSLFGTPPTYSTWYLGDVQTEQATAAVLSSNSAETHSTKSVFDAFMPVCGQKVQPKQKSNLFEDDISTLDYKPTVPVNGCNGASSTNEKASNEIPRMPANRQSLTDFLQMAQHSRNNTELEKENAHFRISEAIISAIEHIKWAKSQHTGNGGQSEAVLATDWLENERKNIQRDARAEVSAEHREETIIGDSGEYIPFVEHSESNLECLSAEVVGLSLISRYANDKYMPKVSELKWLVSDEDTPQKLLPMPDSSPSANPDDNILPPITRGTRYWAPPRPQIIFTDHPTPNRKALIRKQNNRCAGCGMRVSSQNMSSFRYCTYFGKYHCTGCHRNQMSATPAKILQMWDFRFYPVSVFAYRLLEQMYSYPLFHVPDLNPALYIKSKLLLDARNKRLKLKFIKDFIKACRFAVREQGYFSSIPDHITSDIDTWSMSDFVEARNESMQRSINELIEKCENHIFFCVLCTGRGFCCEYCLRDHVIYPWENKVYRCDRCGSCFHLSCWKAMLEVCCRCKRIWNRNNEVAESISTK